MKKERDLKSIEVNNFIILKTIVKSSKEIFLIDSNWTSMEMFGTLAVQEKWNFQYFQKCKQKCI